MKITDLPDGGCLVEMDGEIVLYTKEEIDEMEQDYVDAVQLVSLKRRGEPHHDPRKSLRRHH